MTSSSEWVSISTPYLRPRSLGEPNAWAEETAQQGRTGKQRLREVAEVVPPSGVAEALNSPAGEMVVVRRRVMLLDHVQEDVSARAPSAEERQLLALGHDEWVLVLSRRVMADSGLPIEASVMTMTANGRHLRYQLVV